MKQPRLASALSLTISLQLMLSPLAVANSGQQQANRPTVNSVINQTLNVAGQVYQAYSGGGQGGGPQFQTDMAKLQQQQTPLPDKFFNPQKMMKIPGLAEYLALNNINPQRLNCGTLPTTLHEAQNEVCRLGVSSIQGPHQQAQANEAFAYYNQYLQIDKKYRNFLADSNVDGQGFGVGCMNGAMQILNGFFQYRINELDRLTAMLEKEHDDFLQQTAGVLRTIEGTTAMLEGANAGELTDKVRTEHPHLLNFGSRFDNPSCKAILAAEGFNDLGLQGGLNQISKKLKDDFSRPSPNISAQSYDKNLHAEVVKEMDQISRRVAQQVELNFSDLSGGPGGYNSFLQRLQGSVDMSHPVSLSPSMFGDLQSGFKNKVDDLNARTAQVQRELGAVAGDAIAQLRNLNSKSFNQEVNNIENRLKNQCLQRSLTGPSSVDSIVARIVDSTASDFANQNASNEVKRRIKEILENRETTLEQKQSEINALGKRGMSRLSIKNDAPYTIKRVVDGKLQDETVRAGVTNPSVFLNHVIENCQNQFKYSQGNTMPQAAAVQNLRKLNNDFKDLAKDHAKEVRQELKRKLIECDSPSVANSTVAGSCKPETFNTQRAGFCANAARSCAAKMGDCTKQAEKVTQQLKDQRTANVQTYKQLTEATKRKMKQHFEAARTLFDQAGIALRGEFGIGYEHPTGIEMDIKEGDPRKYQAHLRNATNNSIDGALLLEDPTAFLDMFKRNNEKLKKSIAEQQRALLGDGGRGGLLADHVKKTEQNYTKVTSEAQKLANSCLNNHDKFVRQMEDNQNRAMEEMNKQQGEMGEKRQSFCARYNLALNNNPRAACRGEVMDIITGALGASAGAPGAADTIGAFGEYCHDFGDDTIPTHDDICLAAGIAAGAGADPSKRWHLSQEDFNPQLVKPAERQRYQTQCQALMDFQCPIEERTDSDGKALPPIRPQTCPELTRMQNQLVSRYKTSRQSGTSDLDPNPALCDAGNNSDRSLQRHPFQQMQNPVPPGASRVGFQ
jgi:hypothetical protein